MAKRMIEVPEDVVEAIRQEVIAECKKYFAIALNNWADLPDGLLSAKEWTDVANSFPENAFVMGYKRAAADLNDPDFDF